MFARGCDVKRGIGREGSEERGRIGWKEAGSSGIPYQTRLAVSRRANEGPSLWPRREAAGHGRGRDTSPRAGTAALVAGRVTPRAGESPPPGIVQPPLPADAGKPEKSAGSSGRTRGVSRRVRPICLSKRHSIVGRGRRGFSRSRLLAGFGVRAPLLVAFGALLRGVALPAPTSAGPRAAPWKRAPFSVIGQPWRLVRGRLRPRLPAAPWSLSPGSPAPGSLSRPLPALHCPECVALRRV